MAAFARFSSSGASNDQAFQHDATPQSPKYITNATYQPMVVYGVVGLMYFALCWPLSFWSTRMEHRMAATAR